MKAAGNLAIVGGLLLFLGGATGWGIFATIRSFLLPYLEGDVKETIAWVLEILILLAALGGITVMIGGYLIKKDYERVGKILITIGLSTGVISLIIGLIVAVGSGTYDAFVAGQLSLTGIGTILALIAKFLA
jgi:hypothetical protein